MRKTTTEIITLDPQSLPARIGPHLKRDKIANIYYPKWKLDAQIGQRLKILITRELDKCGVLEEARPRILSEVFDDLSKQNETPSLIPKVAPALYKERSDKSQSAEAFTVFHYSQYFGKGLTRADLKRLDKSLYGMLMKGGFPPSLADDIPPAQGKGGGGRKPVYSPEELAERTRAKTRARTRRSRAKQKQSM